MTAVISWEPIAAEVRASVGVEGFDRWMKNTKVVRCDIDGLVLAVPNQFMKSWSEANFKDNIRTATSGACGREVPVSFIVDPRLSPKVAKPSPESPVEAPRSRQFPRVGATNSMFSLNPNFRLHNFVVSEENRLAFSAARTVSEAPGEVYNPLYLFGAPGVGKTHLLQAIAHEIREQHRIKVIYVTGEYFFGEYIRGLNFDKLKTFRERFYSADVLIVDDIHKLATKKATQMEFQQLFDKLMDQGKQVIISARSFPREIEGLREELVQRFLAGLWDRLDIPDLRGREMIVEQELNKSRCGSSMIGPEIRRYIATNFSSSVRSLIGSTIRLLAYQNLIRQDRPGEKMSLREARLALSQLLEGEKHRCDLTDILEAVARHFRITPNTLVEDTKKKTIALPRQIAMYLARKHTDHSLAEVGRFFGGRAHSTVKFAETKVTEELKGNPVVIQAVNRLEDELLR